MSRIYRGVEITRIYPSGYYSALTANGFVRADTLAGIKSLIRSSNQ